jgi:hypothetical protein
MTCLFPHTSLGFFLPVALLLACSSLVVACALMIAPCYGRSLVTYSFHTRNVFMQHLNRHKMISCAGMGPAETCPINFGAPVGEFSAPMGPNDGMVGRKEQCGGDAAWVAENPPSPKTTCIGFLHCHYFNASVSTCERTREIYTGALDPCFRVGEGKQCGGDEAFMTKVCLIAFRLASVYCPIFEEGSWSCLPRRALTCTTVAGSHTLH